MKKISVLLIAIFITARLSAQTIQKLSIQQLTHWIDTSTTPLVVNFWASWCAPCVREIPWFEKNMAKFSDKKVKLLLVSLDFADEYPDGILAFSRKQHYQSTIVWLNESNPDSFCPKIDKSWDGTIPVSLFVNNAKKYRQFFKQQLPEPRLEQELQKLVQ
ncbi:MAG: redoxin domain-containing protein [Bacteroidota bacterium]|nr:redoxin domain-containing protein [Bacteroidota bacterium]